MAKRSNKDAERWSYKNDYPIDEVYATTHYIARAIVPRLKAFRAYDNKHGYPQGFHSIREWDKAIDKMIYAFELNMYAPGPHPGQEENDFQEGFDLFCKYYTHLWD